MKKDNLQKQWDNAAGAWVDFVHTGKDYYRDELNNPVMFELLGGICGKKVLDLGCGEGYNSRIMARKGAKVVALDFSKEMIDYAIQQERKERLGIDYHALDACDLHVFKDNTFDVVACFMALQDTKNYQDAVREVCRVLKKRGRFVFAIPHPCFGKRIIDGKVIGGWRYTKGKDKTPENALYHKSDRYFDPHSYIISWKMKRLTRHFETTTFHRTLTDYADALYDAGLMISRLKEPKPTKRGLARYPIMRENLRIPQSIVIEAVKVH